MPTYYNKDGIRIEMCPCEEGHNLPHVHASYAGKTIFFALTGEILAGHINQKAQRRAAQWVREHTRELELDWRKYHV